MINFAIISCHSMDYFIFKCYCMKMKYGMNLTKVQIFSWTLSFFLLVLYNLLNNSICGLKSPYNHVIILLGFVPLCLTYCASLCKIYNLITGWRQCGRRRIKFILLDVLNLWHTTRLWRAVYKTQTRRDEAVQHLLPVGLYLFGHSSCHLLYSEVHLAHDRRRAHAIYCQR